MEKPKEYKKVSWISTVFLLFVYIIFGSLTFALFINTPGKIISEIIGGLKGNILSNIRNDSPYFFVCSILMSIICVLSVPNVAMSVFEIVDPKHEIKCMFVTDWKVILVRFAILIVICVISVAIPRFDVLVSLYIFKRNK